jgi:xanthine dehydrogenase accessory factor
MLDKPTRKSRPLPARSTVSDDPTEILGFAADACDDRGAAIATLVDIRGGAARALGSHVVVAADGRFCGYVSGGCVEAAVASEALLALDEGRDRMVMFGEGSPFFDIVLPCGGGITVAIHVLRDAKPIRHVLARLERRQPAALLYSPEAQTLVLTTPVGRAGWDEDAFATVYRPITRLIVSGQSNEADIVSRVAEAAGFDVFNLKPGDAAGKLADLIDPFTAVVLMHHDIENELDVLDAALRSQPLYIGALGSTRTHRKRLDRLGTLGWTDDALARIKAPIGIFGPARDASSLALSVVADVAACRLQAYA